jgi:serine phosphatase RsbU (regulator of sigma subunit)
VALLVLQPRLEDRKLRAAGADTAAQQFLQRSLASGGVDEIAAELGRAVTAALGPTRTLLLAPDGEGGVRLVGDAPAGVELGDPTPAFLWLGDRSEPLTRAELAELEQFDGARETAVLLDTLGCNVLLPLRHRGLLLGLALIDQPGSAAESLAGFYRAMRAYATVAVANSFLGAEARGRGQLTETFDLANAMQESLMPDERPVRRASFELRGLFRPVDECGGDLWAWRELADGKVLLVIADATGHGAAPALLAAVAKGAVDAHWQMSLRDLDPAHLLSALNRAVYRTGRKRYMMTAFAAVVDTRAMTITFANAGQNFPYLIAAYPTAAGGGRVQALIARGNSLGAVPEARFESHTRPIGPGDKLVLYTDGITEAGSPLMEPWGEKRFRAALVAMADERATRLPELLLAEVDQYLGDTRMSDDITMCVLQLVGDDDKVGVA